MTGILEGRVALITGAGRGIGAATARRFAAEGCRVLVNDVDEAAARAVATETGGLAHVADVADEAQVAAMVATCVATLGRLDVLINNAAVAGARLPAAQMERDAFDRTLAVNLRGVMLCIKHAAAPLKQRGGTIINVSSRGVSPHRSDYVASKAAVRALTEVAAFELGPHGVRVCTLSPGTVNTEMMHRSLDQWAARDGCTVADVLERHYFARAALKKLVEPDEVAQGALFLAAAATAVTAAELRVNAGRM